MAWGTHACLIAAFLGVLWVPLARAAPPAKMPTIGWLSLGFPPSGPNRQRSPFFEGLKELGWVEGKNIAVEGRYAEGQVDRLPELAADLVRLKVDVIVAGDSTAIPAAKSATSTIPIVMTVSGDPVAQGFIASLARPDGNITGLSAMSPQLAAKRLQLLKEIVPTMSRVAVLGPPGFPDWAELRAATQVARVEFVSLEVTRADQFETAFDTARQKRADALIVLPGPLTNANRQRIVALAASRNLPTMYAISPYVRGGGLVAYGPNIDDLFHRAANYVDKILRGAKPADLPVEQPQKFELTINLKTAKDLGLTIPSSMILSADEVIR